MSCPLTIRATSSQAELLRVLQKQAVEVSRARRRRSTVTLPVKKSAKPKKGCQRFERKRRAPRSHHPRISRWQLHHSNGPALFPHR